MRTLHAPLLLALLLGALAAPLAAAADSAPARNPIRPISDCLDTSRSMEVYTPDDRTVIVKTGPRYYRIDLMNACPRLNAATLKFHLAADKRGAQRMCGELGDKIINGEGLRCAVKGMALIDQATFKRLEAKSIAR